MTKQNICETILSTKKIGTQHMKKKTNKRQELKEILRDVQNFAQKLKDDPKNNKIENALYTYQVWSLKQAEKALTLIERIRNNKQK